MATKKTTSHSTNGRVNDEHKEAEIQAAFERLQRKGWENLSANEKLFMVARLTYLDAQEKEAS